MEDLPGNPQACRSFPQDDRKHGRDGDRPPQAVGRTGRTGAEEDVVEKMRIWMLVLVALLALVSAISFFVERG
ncbi:hypothetical protein [Thermostaphylospora chromogena]|uniref:hypothetical protein n=1 Tax=Thermostaphylospora chromogena TaxID=35622 RepID=UPI0010422743|nr:hypothetical protein [Thermostaphylospora chromogena]